MHKDLYRARAAAMSHDPDLHRCRQGRGPGAAGTERQARRRRDPRADAQRLGRRPDLRGRRDTSVEEINDAIRAAASDGPLKGVLGYTDEKLVSMDFNHDPHSSIFHTDQTKVMDGNMCRILTWYDNEWGFSNRMADTAVEMGKYL
jgi:glyceraldehyde 3-phosphate dehydrogenase